MRLRVVTLNVWNRQGDPKRTGLINRELRRLAPDLVSFQEVVKSPDRSQLDELIHDTDLYGTHQADVLRSVPPHADRFGGSAVATRWPHQVEEVLDLRMSDANDVPWCSLAVAVPLPGEADVLFIAATTSWRLAAESARERQVVALTDLDARHRRALPTIIAGDFNATPDAASIRYIRGFAVTGRAEREISRRLGGRRRKSWPYLERRQSECKVGDRHDRSPAASSPQGRLCVRGLLGRPSEGCLRGSSRISRVRPAGRRHQAQ